ncbi:MAG: ComF family protein [Clostridia bacterium]|nr:ComF family protein [Clostridia bacterium]
MRFIDKLLNWIFPPKCVCCDEILDYESEEIFCENCLLEWEILKKEKCRTCGQPLWECYCGMRDNHDGLVDAELHLVQYDKKLDNAVNKLVFSCKDRTVSAYFRGVAKEMYKCLYPRLPKDSYVVMPVPRTRLAKKMKGHDQSEFIAKEFCKLDDFIYCDLIYNVGEKSQKLSVNQRERSENAKKSYKIMQDNEKILKGRNVILIDDVITTGSSVVRCAKLIKSKGAKKVYAFSIAKTVR